MTYPGLLISSITFPIPPCPITFSSPLGDEFFTLVRGMTFVCECVFDELDGETVLFYKTLIFNIIFSFFKKIHIYK